MNTFLIDNAYTYPITRDLFILLLDIFGGIEDVNAIVGIILMNILRNATPLRNKFKIEFHRSPRFV